MENPHDETLRLIPPVAVSITSFLGIPLSDWVYITTIIYTTVNIIFVGYKAYKHIKELK